MVIFAYILSTHCKQKYKNLYEVCKEYEARKFAREWTVHFNHFLYSSCIANTVGLLIPVVYNLLTLSDGVC